MSDTEPGQIASRRVHTNRDSHLMIAAMDGEQAVKLHVGVAGGSDLAVDAIRPDREARGGTMTAEALQLAGAGTERRVQVRQVLTVSVTELVAAVETQLLLD